MDIPTHRRRVRFERLRLEGAARSHHILDSAQPMELLRIRPKGDSHVANSRRIRSNSNGSQRTRPSEPSVQLLSAELSSARFDSTRLGPTPESRQIVRQHCRAPRACLTAPRDGRPFSGVFEPTSSDGRAPDRLARYAIARTCQLHASTLVYFHSIPFVSVSHLKRA